ncbi:hypothetical protein L538_2059, partial [Bordetella hinzii 4161]
MSAAGAAALAARLAGAVDTARLAARQRGLAGHGGVATGGVGRQGPGRGEW